MLLDMIIKKKWEWKKVKSVKSALCWRLIHYGRKQTDGKGGSENFLLEVFPKIKTVETITKLSETKITAQNSKYKESMDQQTWRRLKWIRQ